MEYNASIPTILIVEDEKPMLKALVTKFGSNGFRVLSAGNGADGLQLALAQKPAIILLDLLMPRMNGLEVIKGLRGNPAGKNIPIILLTNMSDMEKLAEAQNYGVFDYLVKTDWSIDDVLKKVREKLESKR